jgi:hypothetical protein
MSDKSLAQKLAIKEGFQVLLVRAPEGYAERLGPLPAGASLNTPAGPYDVVQLFVATQRELEATLPPLLLLLKPKGYIWVTWHKGGSRVKGEVTRDTIWPFSATIGLQPVSNIAVDDDWSALRLKIVA